MQASLQARAFVVAAPRTLSEQWMKTSEHRRRSWPEHRTTVTSSGHRNSVLCRQNHILQRNLRQRNQHNPRQHNVLRQHPRQLTLRHHSSQRHQHFRYHQSFSCLKLNQQCRRGHLGSRHLVMMPQRRRPRHRRTPTNHV